MAIDLESLTTATRDPLDRTNPPVVRLRPGIDIGTAQAQFATVMTRLQHDVAPQPGGRPWNVRLSPMRTVLFGRDRPYLLVVVAAGSLVLLMACANLASLLLARGRSRERDAAIRASLGASRGQLIAGALFESLLICACGGLVAIAVLAWSGPAVLAVLPPLFSHAAAGLGDLRVLGFALIAGVTSAVVAGVVPGWRAARVDVLAVLQRTSTSGRRMRGAGRQVLAVEAALGVMIVLAAAVSVRSFSGLARTPVNFDATDLYWVGVRIPQKDASLNFESYRQALDVIRAEPGVRAAAGGDPALPTTPVAPAAFAPDFGPTCCRWRITDGLFETLGTPILSGRAFTDAEIRAGAPVAILNVSGVRLVWPDLDPAQAVGRTLHFRNEPARGVVGVVPDIRPSPDRRAEAGVYVPATSAGFRLMEFAARMDPGARPSLPHLQKSIAERVAAPVAVFVNPASMRVEAALRDPRFRAVAFSVFAIVALLLAAVGLYGVASFDAALRRYELGVRLALGASARQVEWLVIADALRPIAVGIGIGLLGAYWAVGLLQSFLPGTDGRAPGMFVVVVAVIGATGVAAAWLPARRAARLDPATVLKEQ
jgi:predicted permease